MGAKALLFGWHRQLYVLRFIDSLGFRYIPTP
jgi:hypothetical protein